MISRIFAILALAALIPPTSHAAFSPASPRQFTLLKGNADAMLVQEYAVGGCVAVAIDSVVRRAVRVGPIENAYSGGSESFSSAATVYWKYTSPKLDSACAETCRSVRTIRRIDSIPRVSLYSWTEGTDLSVEIPIPVDPDSLFACMGDACEKVETRLVENDPSAEQCLVGVLSPLPTVEAAAAYLKGKLDSASEVFVLDRQIVLTPPVLIPLVDSSLCKITPPIIYTVDPAARAASLLPVTVSETRLVTDSRSIQVAKALFPPLADWRDPSLTGDLALPSSANAGDFFQSETLSFTARSWTNSALSVATLRYASGIKRYLYRGDDPIYLTTLTCQLQELGISHRVGDSLRLEGRSVRITNEGCPRRGIDVHAGNYDQWLYAPTGNGTFQQEFAHGGNAETGTSWPIVDDSVLVRGQKIPVALLQAVASTHPRDATLRSLSARILAGTVSITLEAPSRVTLAGASGQILSRRDLPAGTSSLALPRGHSGIVLVNTGRGTVRLLAP